MKKVKRYDLTRFSADVLKEAASAFTNILLPDKAPEKWHYILSVDHDDNSKWEYDNLEEFFADYRKYKKEALFQLFSGIYHAFVNIYSDRTVIDVTAPTRNDIEFIFNIFEKHLEASKFPPESKPKKPKEIPSIFIGHGRSKIWQELKDHLQDKHEIKVIAYETGARAGHTIRDILEEMVSKSSMAFLVYTAEDELSNGTFNARMNVIHETGLFQGRLGFNKGIILLEEGTNEFSNINGIQQIRFSKGNIKETFGEVLATIKREFGT